MQPNDVKPPLISVRAYEAVLAHLEISGTLFITNLHLIILHFDYRISWHLRIAEYNCFDHDHPVHMAPRKRNQSPLACENPETVYREPDPDPGEETEEDSVMPKQRNRNLGQGDSRAVPATFPKLARKLDEILWKQLGDDIVEVILSRLPVYKLWQTVMALNPTRWKQIYSNDGNAYTDGILGHGNHIDSSIGYMKIYEKLTFHQCTCLRGPLHLLPTPLVLEHDTQTWQSLPKPAELDKRTWLCIHGGDDGLMLLVHPLTTPIRSGHYFERMVVWNPASQAYRQLPPSPFSLSIDDSHCYPHCATEVLAVDQDRTGYKVMDLVSMDWVPGKSQESLSCYVIYSSVSGSWGGIRPAPQNMLKLVGLNCVSCEGCVCFITMERQLVPGEKYLTGLVCYNPTCDVWSEVVTFPTSLFDGVHPRSITSVRPLLYASGKVYVIFNHVMKNSSLVDVTSIDLVDIQSGVAAFDLVGRVRESRSAGNNYPDGKHPAAKYPRSSPRSSSRSRRSELTLQCRCLQHSDSHHWYILSVGGTVYLCAVFCGRWHRRFDLVAGEWTGFQMQVPSDTRRAETMCTGLGFSYVPYIPSWVKV